MLSFAITFASLTLIAAPVQQVQVHVDSARSEVVLSLTGVSLAPSENYDAMQEFRAYFSWPVKGWVRGFRIDVFDANGRLLPRSVLHHGGVANFSRRQLAYSMVERLFAAGRETEPVTLPAAYGVPIDSTATLGMYVALVNPFAAPLENVTVRMTALWTPESKRPSHELFPIVLGANQNFTTDRSFDIPAGRSTTTAEFTVPAGGWLRAVGAHAHDYATEMRLEDVATGKTLVRLKAKRDASGKLISIGSTKFPFKRRGLELVPGRKYRVVAVYDNPTSETISRGAMAFLGGVFVPRDRSAWPALNLEDPALLADIAGLRGMGGQTHAHAHHK